MLAYASLGGFVVSKPRLHVLLDPKLVRLAKWLATKREMEFFLNFEVSFQLKTKYPNNELKIALFHRFIQKLMIRLD